MTDRDVDQQPWGACPSGELRALAQRLQAEHRRRGVVRIAQFSALGLLVIGAGIATGSLVVGRRAPGVPPVLASLNCQECKEHFEAYHLHLTGDQPMGTELAERMRAHLLHCKSCRLAFEKQYPDVMIALIHAGIEAVASGHRPAAAAGKMLLAAAASP